MKISLDLKLNFTAILAFLILVIMTPCVLLLPEYLGYENGLFENIQMGVLFLCCFFALRASGNKKFFTFIFLFLTILILREVNCGRTLFFPIPNEPNAFYSWKDLGLNKIVHSVFGAYIGLVGLYFIFNKLWNDLKFFLFETKIPLFNVIFLAVGIFLSLVAEKFANNLIFEELSELIMYLSILGIIYTYSKNIKITETNSAN